MIVKCPFHRLFLFVYGGCPYSAANDAGRLLAFCPRNSNIPLKLGQYHECWCIPSMTTPSTTLVLNFYDEGLLVFPEKLSQLLERVLR